MPKCSFCGHMIERGTGKALIKNDGKVLYFCSTKCEKNTTKLKRKAREQKWTKESRNVRGKKD
ncbi:50S ribosomal protein L24e [Candidatus Woesearchaeota archaeon]|nr:50S ribosomal protein L24e [Candidatus Woesearchaeota archaeon]